MAQTASSQIVPHRLLLATDLSGGGDRAFDRAVDLARPRDAALHVVHAVQAQPAAVPVGVDAGAHQLRIADPRLEARRQLHAPVGHADVAATVHVVDGAHAEAILALAEREGADPTAIGAHPCGMLFDAVIGGSRSMVEAIPGDILVVRAVRGNAA